jgi:HAMP domain-containing protein
MTAPDIISRTKILPKEATPQRGLATLWARLPIRGKILIPLIVLVLIIFTTLGLFVNSSIEALVQNTLSFNFTSESNRQQSQVEAFYSDARRTIINISGSFQVQALARLLQEGNATEDELDNVKRDLQDLMINALGLPRIDIADMRFLTPDGEQIVRVRSIGLGQSGIPMESESLVSERGAQYLRAVFSTPENTVFLSPATITTPIDPRDTFEDVQIQAATPVYIDGRLAGVVVADLRPRRYFLEAFQPNPDSQFNFTTYIYDRAGNLLISTNIQQQPPIRVFGDVDLSAPTLPGPVANTSTLALRRIENQNYRVSTFSGEGKGISGADWRLVLTNPVGAGIPITQGALLNETFGRFIGILAFLAIFYVLIGRSILRPIRELEKGARAIAGGKLTTQVPIYAKDELGELGMVLNGMTEQLQNLVESLENRVRERTRNIEIAADIGRNATQIRDINELLQTTVESIRQRFNFYHAQVFLLDDVGEDAILVASTGDAGRKLLARNHKLGVGSQSIIGQVTQKRRTFISLDTENSEVPHRPNDLLPLTRSEMALPLVAGNILIGALDVQSTERNAFGDSDKQIFQILADQLAIAIDNTRLLEASKRQVEEISTC